MKILWRKEHQVREERRRALVELNLLEDQKRKPSATTRKRGWHMPFMALVAIPTRALLARSGPRHRRPA